MTLKLNHPKTHTEVEWKQEIARFQHKNRKIEENFAENSPDQASKGMKKPKVKTSSGKNKDGFNKNSND